MLSKLTIIITIFCVLFSVSGILGQEYGVITDEEWALEPPVDYPGANAVIIFDIGVYKLTKNTFSVTRHCRVKVFNKDAARNVTEVDIPYSKGDKFKSLKAHTYTKDGQKIEVKEYVKKKIDDTDFNSFAFPSVDNGAIIEYSYTLNIKRYWNNEWRFQKTDYTLRSNFTLDASDRFKFQVTYRGIPFSLQLPGLKQVIKESKDLPTFHLEMTNIAPASDEPFMGAKNDFIAAVSFDVIEYEGQRGKYSYLTPWDELGNNVYEYFISDFVKSKKKISTLSDSVCMGIFEPRAKCEALYNYVHQEIATDIDERNISSIFDVVKRKKGTQFQQSELLAGLLFAQGISANLVFIGTRSQTGQLDHTKRDLNQFNRLICYVQYDSTEFGLDAADQYAEFPYLPVDDLVDQGLFLDSINSKLLSFVHPERKNGTDVGSIIHIDEDGGAVCSTTVYFKGYAKSFLFKRMEDSVSTEKLIKDYLDNDIEIEYDYKMISSSIVREDELDRIRLDVVMKITDFAEDIDGTVFFSPFIIPIEKNVFIKQQRLFPIDFGYVYSNRHRIQVTLPTNMVITNKLSTIFKTFKVGSFKRQVSAADNMLMIKADYSISRAKFSPGTYRQIQEFFEILSEASQDQAAASPIAVEGDGQ
ncbi:MAG: DUF3857 domain-containing protein [candidate division Zixibacteria bacterium]|nr:DUF3857 domain-containing protein [candidate division Zixibacteria bacterium]